MPIPKQGEREARTVSFTELRATNEFCITGRAVCYGVASRNLGGFIERVRAGTFARSLRNGADVHALVQHDANQVLGRTKNGTLTLEDKSDGLYFRVQLDREVSWHRDFYSQVQRGDYDECSFSFLVPKNGDRWEEKGETDDSGRPVVTRTLLDVDLLDVSVVTTPAYPEGTSAAARSMDADDDDEADYNALIRPTSTAPMRTATGQRLAEAETDRANRARAAAIGARIEADRAEESVRAAAEKREAERQAQADEELRERMRVAAGRAKR